MRDIEFRGISLETGKWVYGGYCFTRDRGPCIIVSGHISVPVNPETVGQYINLDCRAETRIYVGDKVRWDDASKGKYWRVAEVIATPGCFAFRIIPNASINCFADGWTTDFRAGNFIYCPDTSRHGNVMEVIGTIHKEVPCHK